MEKQFWDKVAPIYNRFMKKDKDAYAEVCSLIREKAAGKKVLEVCTGTGLIAKEVADVTEYMYAIDYSPKMIEQAKKGSYSEKLEFVTGDALMLPFSDESFELVIISNSLHIMPEPEKALAEIKRVLTPDGMMIAPTFTHAGMSVGQNMLAGSMGSFTGFKTDRAWTRDSFVDFLHDNGWRISRGKVIKASFPETYVECVISTKNARNTSL